MIGQGLAGIIERFSPQRIMNDIQAYMASGPAPYWHWYVGITSDPRPRLFREHGVAENGYGWIYRQALTHEDARVIELFFIDHIGTAGGVGGGDSSSTYVYAYLKDRLTNP